VRSHRWILCLVGGLVVAPEALAQPENPAPVEVKWLASTVGVSCEASLPGETPWWDAEFDDSAWSAIELPDENSIPFPGDRFYRGHFLASPGATVVLDWQSDDGSWVWLNGEFLGHWGGDCHEGGCVGGAGDCGGPGGQLDLTGRVRPGENLLAVHVSNSSYCCRSLFAATVSTDALTPLAVERLGDPGAPPSAPELATTLEVHVTSPSVDPEGQGIYYSYRWASSGGDEVVHGPFARPSDRLTETDLVDPGEIWTVTVTPMDGVNAGPARTVGFLIPNRGGLADVNNDGRIDAADVTAVVNRLVGVEEHRETPAP
jgi:hypothetical protein